MACCAVNFTRRLVGQFCIGMETKLSKAVVFTPGWRLPVFRLAIFDSQHFRTTANRSAMLGYSLLSHEAIRLSGPPGNQQRLVSVVVSVVTFKIRKFNQIWSQNKSEVTSHALLTGSVCSVQVGYQTLFTREFLPSEHVRLARLISS